MCVFHLTGVDPPTGGKNLKVLLDSDFIEECALVIEKNTDLAPSG